MWSARQTAMQLTNRWGKIWNPLSLLGNVGGQHIGLRLERAFFDPTSASNLLGVTATQKYTVSDDSNSLIGSALSSIPSNPLTNFFDNPIDLKEIFEKRLKPSVGSNKGGEVISEALNIVQTFTGGFTLPSALGGLLSVDKWRVDKFGGFNSTYGFGITTTSRFENTFINTEGTPKFKANEKAKYIQKYNPFDENVTKYAPQSNDSDKTQKKTNDGTLLNLTGPVGSILGGLSNFGLGSVVDSIPSLDSISNKASSFTENLTNIPGLPSISDYTSLPYDKLPIRGETLSGINDFRNDIGGDSAES